ncbi:MAG: succinate dehydrogenase [Burkholderiaceae bacterium]
MQHARREALLWAAQRASAVVLAVCVMVHIVTIVYATRGGLSGAEILERTRGNQAWFVFYAVFVLAVAVHAPIGLRAIAIEWLGWRSRWRDIALLIFAVTLIAMGFGATRSLFVA